MDIARPSHACLRCRRQKKRCNRGIPKCSHCLRANAACSREIFISGSHVAVRTVAELEAEVARLEAQVAAGGHVHPDRVHMSPGMTQGESRQDAAEPIPVLDIDTSRKGQTPNLGVLADLNNATVYDYENYNLARMLNSALILGNDTLDAHSKKQLGRPLALFRSATDGRSPLQDLPKDLRAWYLQRYLEHVNPIFPILDAEDIRSSLESLENGQSIGPCETSLAYLALAIGAVFPSTDSLMDASAACQLWQAASNEQSFHDETPNTVRILILLTLFSLLEEGFGSSWHLVELVVRSCIKLGLHNKTSEQTSGTELFWSAYLLDRWISCTLGLPVLIHNEEFDQQIPEAPSESGQELSPIPLWRMAYGLLGDESGLPNNLQEATWFSRAGSPPPASLHPPNLLQNMIAADLRIAHASRCILREGEATAQRFDDTALHHLSVIETAIKRGSTLPWTTGYTTFLSVMIRLVSFGKISRCGLLFTQNTPDSVYISRAVDVLRFLARTFRSLECLGDLLGHLSQVGTASISGSNEASIGVPRHSGIFTITSRALQSIGVSCS
ncbi:uncharacterized protein NECHADRAFT_101083 [Fusarium vanettenii 77-13-4]|uniref:Expressed protein n=1 Tax=Fusarium vanettenii (strain ATCC MYA-4622 / CBS 123669 / FGSC 9596 / NRRL 45880 / 77-13-4) TaxID=660122 RepID=C7YXN1_FUSV7|nr:uncharacterized protein NECHADRAFT_101083 [Fusarium vanettenii 77-13-4]EEU43617.1 expressed protein [Fusarium vanettenii 77-13-4]